MADTDLIERATKAIDLFDAICNIHDPSVSAHDRRVMAMAKVIEAAPSPSPSPGVEQIAETHLSNLLARIHRDGGHYEAEHGTDKACEDADRIIAELYAATPANPAQVTDALSDKYQHQDEIERIILRRVRENRVEGFTLEMAHEIAAIGAGERLLNETGGAQLLDGGKLGCLDCGEPYGSKRFPDLIIDNDAFAKIAPNPPDGGLLCPNCICARLSKAGLSNVKSRFTSGPLCCDAIGAGGQAVDQGLRDAAKAMGAEVARSEPVVSSQPHPADERVVEALDALRIDRDNEAERRVRARREKDTTMVAVHAYAEGVLTGHIKSFEAALAQEGRNG